MPNLKTLGSQTREYTREVKTPPPLKKKQTYTLIEDPSPYRVKFRYNGLKFLLSFGRDTSVLSHIGVLRIVLSVQNLAHQSK